MAIGTQDTAQSQTSGRVRGAFLASGSGTRERAPPPDLGSVSVENVLYAYMDLGVSHKSLRPDGLEVPTLCVCES